MRTLRRVSAAPSPIAAGAPRVPPPYGTNDDVAAGRRFMFVIDQESFVAGREQLFRNAIDGLLAQLTPADRTMVAALPFGGVMVPFTSDIARLRLAAGRVTGQGARVETGSDLACRTRRFLESLEGLLRTQATQASPQTLIVFTAGLAGPRRDAPMGILPGMCELVVDLFRHVGTTASAARANVYVMQPADIGIGASLPRPTPGGVGDIGSDNPLEGIEHLAGVTGGARLPLDATGTGSLLRVARESSAYYVAELEPVRGEVFGRSRALGVRVARRGVIVRARPEITFTDTEQARTTRLVVTDILASTEAATDLRLRVGSFTVRDADGKLRVGVLVEPADGSVGLAAAGAILIEGNGRVAAHWNARDATERPLLGAMTAPGGAYRVRAAAIDTTGRAGAAEAEIEVGLTEVGGLSLGSLLLGISRSGTTCSAAGVRIRADREGLIRHLRRDCRSATVGDARTVARSRWPRYYRCASRVDPHRRDARRRNGDGAARRSAAGRLRGARHHPPRGRHDWARGADAEESGEVGLGYATATRLSSSRLPSRWPAPRTTVSRGFSARMTRRPVCFSRCLSIFRSNATPPVSTTPRS